MDHSDAPEWTLIRRLRDQIVVYSFEPAGSLWAVVCNVPSYFFEVDDGFRVRSEADHADLLRSASIFAFRRAKASSGRGNRSSRIKYIASKKAEAEDGPPSSTAPDAQLNTPREHRRALSNFA
jgi:hypothetical protein